MKIAFIVNGSSKKLIQTIKQIEHVFRADSYITFLSESKYHICDLTKGAILSGHHVIIACGGDGTLNETINGVINTYKLDDKKGNVSYDWKAISKIRVGLVPIGSGNDFAKTTLVPDLSSLEKLKSLIFQDTSQFIDIGHVTYKTIEGKDAVRFFVNITDVGMGGEVVSKLDNKNIRKLGAGFNYSWAITSTLATFKKASIRAYSEGFEWEGEAMNFVVANGRYFGKGLCVAPEADLSDGMFDITILGDISLLDYFKNIGKVRKCHKIIHPKVEYRRLKKVTIESTDERLLAIDMDGEYIGHAPMTLENLHQKIRFIF